MKPDFETLSAALYVKIDDEIGGTAWMGRPPLLSDSELVCLAVAQALLGNDGEPWPGVIDEVPSPSSPW